MKVVDRPFEGIRGRGKDRHKPLFLHEVVIPCLGDPLFGQPGIASVVAGIIDEEFDEVAGMTGVGGDTEMKTV